MKKQKKKKRKKLIFLFTVVCEENKMISVFKGKLIHINVDLKTCYL